MKKLALAAALGVVPALGLAGVLVPTLTTDSRR